MSTIAHALRTRLIDQVAAVSGRVYAFRVPEENVFPAIALYQSAAIPRESAMGEDIGIARVIFQVSVWSASYSEALSVSQAARVALQRLSATIDGVEILDTFLQNAGFFFEEESRLYQLYQDYEVIYRE